MKVLVNLRAKDSVQVLAKHPVKALVKMVVPVEHGNRNKGFGYFL